jgi:hypothetical protein
MINLLNHGHGACHRGCDPGALAMTQLYAVEVQICATAYVRAESSDAAKKTAQEFIFERTLHLAGEEISGLSFDNPRLPDVSLSPAMSGHGVWPDSEPWVAG